MGVKEAKPAQIDPELIKENYQSTLAKFGVDWAFKMWNSPGFSPWDLYRMGGFYFATAFFKGRVSRMN